LGSKRGITHAVGKRLALLRSNQRLEKESLESYSFIIVGKNTGNELKATLHAKNIN
jgi:hypothetical protein